MQFLIGLAILLTPFVIVVLILKQFMSLTFAIVIALPLIYLVFSWMSRSHAEGKRAGSGTAFDQTIEELFKYRAKGFAPKDAIRHLLLDTSEGGKGRAETFIRDCVECTDKTDEEGLFCDFAYAIHCDLDGTPETPEVGMQQLSDLKASYIHHRELFKKKFRDDVEKLKN
jgi:hypothetical protein